MKLPQITRLFPSTMARHVLISLLWVFLLTLGIMNAYTVANQRQGTWPQRLAALRSPLSPEPHIYLARLFWENGNADRAFEELTIAESLTVSPITNDTESPAVSVLGIQSSPLELISVWKSQSERMMERYRYWKRVIEERPAYRDAYIMAGISAAQAGLTSDAMSMYTEAEKLDPNSSLIRSLMDAVND